MAPNCTQNKSSREVGGLVGKAYWKQEEGIEEKYLEKSRKGHQRGVTPKTGNGEFNQECGRGEPKKCREKRSQDIDKSQHQKRKKASPPEIRTLVSCEREDGEKRWVPNDSNNLVGSYLKKVIDKEGFQARKKSKICLLGTRETR